MPMTQTIVVKKEVRRVYSTTSTSDDSAIMQQVFATHAPDGRQVDLDVLIKVIEDALQHAVPPEIECVINQGADIHADIGEETEVISGFDFLHSIPDGLAQIIHQVSCELDCKCSGGGDAHASTIAILNLLSNYTWEAKVVIALGAFTIIFGEFWLLAQLYATNQLAKSIATLKHMPNVIENYKILKPRFDAINILIKSMLDVTKCIVAVKNLPYQYLKDDEAPKSTATTQVPSATYWSVKSMVACTSQLTSLLGMNYDRYITATSESWELSSLAQNVDNIHQQLKSLLELCYQYIETKQQEEYHLMLVRINEVPQTDNLKILRALFCSKDDVHPLLHGYSKTRVNVDILRKKTVLLLVSDLEITNEEISILNQIYRDSRTNQDLEYEIVWVPVVDMTTWNDSQQEKLEQLQLIMTWHTVHHPILLDTGVVQFIKQEWKFEKKSILVTLDQQGNVQSQNALYMVWIWGNSAYPFTTTKEETLWKEESWKLEFLVGSIDKNITSWVSEEKHICLYGGDDIDWIREYTKQVKEVATSSGITVELLYVGKSGTKEKVKKVCKIINEEKLSNTLADQTEVWYFWTRLQSMLHSKIQQNQTLENDYIMKEVITMMSLNGSDQGWTLISKGSTEMVKANADLALATLTQYEQWGGSVSEKGFVVAFKGSVEKLHTSHHCNRLILPEISSGMPEVLVCSDCGRPMEKFIMFRCCTD